MKYFPAFAILTFFAGTIIWFWFFSRKLKRDHLRKLISRAIIKQQEHTSRKIFYSGSLVKALTNYLLFQKRSQSIETLEQLQNGNIESLILQLKRCRKPVEAEELRAMSDFETAMENLQEMVQKQTGSKALLALCGLHFNQGEMAKAQQCLNRIDEKKLRGFSKAKWLYYQTFFDLQDGDLFSASEHCSKAIRIFNQTQNFYEEAEAHFLFGTIYRISGLFDTAQFVFEAAAKIFKDLKAIKPEAETWGNLGMLMTAQNRYEESESLYQKSLKLYQQIGQKQGEAEIVNQQALDALIGGKYEQSKLWAQEALEIHHKLHNCNGEAFSLETLSNIAVVQEDWETASSNAVKAQKLYSKAQNVPAMLEAMLLNARALFELDDLPKAEKILRKIIELSQKQNSCFHVANAYNLLGLLFIKRGDLKRAKGLFQQSLDNELKNERCQGIAIDYANLALIEHRRGHREQAQKMLQTALEYAKTYGENELSELLEQRLSKNPTQK